MLGCDYEIFYKKGKENVVDDSLSRQYVDFRSFLALSVPIHEWFEVYLQEWFNDPSATQLIHTLKTTPHSLQGYTWQDDTLRYKGHLVLIPNSSLKQNIIHDLHSSATLDL